MANKETGNNKTKDTIDLYAANYDHPGGAFFEGECEKVLFRLDSFMRIWYNEVDASFPVHWHTSMEIILCETNTYTIPTPEKEYVLEAGDIIIIPSGHLHGCTAPSWGTRFVHLFDLSFMEKLSDYNRIQHIIAEPYVISKVTHPKIYDDIYLLLSRIREDYFRQRDFYELSIAHLLLKMFVIIGEDHIQTNQIFADEGTQNQKRYISEFNKILTYIDTHYMDNITLEDAAANMGFSKFHFSRLFKEYTGFTFCNYINFRRLKVCEELLANDSLSITEVAMRSGFPSISTFNRLFLEAKGCSPSEFRAKIQTSDKRLW